MSALDFLSALWLGITTSLLPCPLATNITAISFIAGQVGSRRHSLMAGGLYILGRSLTYTVLAWILLTGLLKQQTLSTLLQTHMNQVLGPILIIVGVFLTGLIELNLTLSLSGERLQGAARASGVWGGLLLGVVFALALCPPSALAFFGLIALSARAGDALVMPALFGAGTALPVALFACLIAWSAGVVGRVHHRVTAVEAWTRRVTGTVFIIVGLYYAVCFNLGLV
ncbi:MAG: aromatic aminobenezylarsenical efflux permease ArsG family transporter [Planctomycetota bacterium]|jgi:cytochrome c biogenesis protein CcdA